MAKHRSQKLRLISVAAICNRNGHSATYDEIMHTASPAPCSPWIGANISLLLVLQTRISCLFCETRNRGHGKRASKTQQSTRRSRENKRLMSIVLSLRPIISAYLRNSPYFACSFLVRRFQLIILFPFSCATANNRCSAGTEKNEKRKVSNCLLFVFVSNSLLPPYFSC